MRSLHLALSYSTENSCFSHPKTAYSKSLITPYFPKSLKLAFHPKTQVSSQNTLQPNLITKNISSSNLTQHNNINNSPQIIKNHNSPFMTHFHLKLIK